MHDKLLTMELGVKVVIPSDHPRAKRGQGRNPLCVRVGGNKRGHECGHLTEPLPVLPSDSILCFIQLKSKELFNGKTDFFCIILNLQTCQIYEWMGSNK